MCLLRVVANTCKILKAGIKNIINWNLYCKIIVPNFKQESEYLQVVLLATIEKWEYSSINYYLIQLDFSCFQRDLGKIICYNQNQD